MELKGKRINFLGDSITEGCCATSYDKCFVEIMRQTCSLAAARNYGIGGTRIARQRTPSAEPKYDRDFCSRVSEMDADADIVLVFGGTNDHGHGNAPLGTVEDQTPDTFHGALNTLYSLLKEHFPGAAIVVLTPLHRADENTPKEDSGAVLSDYVEIIRNAAHRHGLPVLDLYAASAIAAHIPEVAQQLTTDGLHPNDEGHAILAQEIAAFLKEL